MTKNKLIWAALLPAVITSSAQALDWFGADSNKSQYSLFNPTPDSMWRPYYLDHGAISPFTIDAGAFSADVNAFQFTYDGRFSGGVHAIQDNWNFGSSWVKVGVCNNTDVEAGWTPYSIHRLTEDDRQTRSGVGDFMTRAKLNLFGNDGGNASLALLGTIQYPTASSEIKPHDQYTGGPGLAFQYNFCDNFDCRINSGVTFSESDSGCWDECYCEDLIFEYMFCPKSYGYVGFDSTVSSRRDTDWEASAKVGVVEASAKVGVVYRFTPNIAVFAEEDRGVHALGTEYRTSVGFDVRF